MLGQNVKLNGDDLVPLGNSYSYRKRVHVHEKDRTLIYPNNNYLDIAMQILSLEGEDPDATPSAENFLEQIFDSSGRQ